MKIIEYSQDYTEKIINIWNESLYMDQINTNTFLKQILFDENFDSSLFLLAINEQEVCGFLFGIMRRFPYLERGLEPQRAWISTMAVAKDYQGQGIGKALIEGIEQRVCERGATSITIASYSPNYFFPGIDTCAYNDAITFFKKAGYIFNDEAVSMKKELFLYHMDKKIIEKRYEAELNGYHFIKFTYAYTLKLLTFLGREFGGGWKRNALNALQNNEAEDLIWIVTDVHDQVVGFCMRKMDGCEARFGPFGIDERLRSMGLGSILFEYMMEDMKKHKIYQLYFLWTHGAGMRFYQRHGVKIYRTFALGSKEIGEKNENI